MSILPSSRLAFDSGCVTASPSIDCRLHSPLAVSLHAARGVQTSAVGSRTRPGRSSHRLRSRVGLKAGIDKNHLGNRSILSSAQMRQLAAGTESTTSVRDSADGSSSSTSEAQAGEASQSKPVTSEHAAEPAKQEASLPVTKDQVALKSLDAYFEKLRGPEKKEEQPPPVAAPAASTAASAATASAPTDAQEPKASAGAQEGQKSSEVDEIVTLLKKLTETKPGETGKSLGDDPNMQVFNIELKSEYQRWLDAQLSITPPTALNILIAVNVAVFLFELASPEAVPGLIITSLPSLLGAKVNALIAAGEWWRLVTPMFLHAGFFHILLGSVVLLSYGPAIEAAFGSFGFFAAYFVGGVFGDLMSYLQTADVTVGGTGPIYGILGAYLVYLWKNKDAIGKEEAESTFWSFLFFGALNVALGSSLPIDDWTHIGAAMGGLLFGALAAPTLKRTTIGFSELKDVIKAEMDKQGGVVVGEEGGSKSSPDSSKRGGKPLDGVTGGTLFLLEGPGPKRQAWIMAACLGAAALLLQLSTAGIPQELLAVSDQITTI